MARKLNAEYIRRIMLRRELRGLPAVLLTGVQFGVSTDNESLLGDDGWIDDTASLCYDQDRFNYRGWNKPGKLYCTKCWSQIVGIPREIVLQNRCRFCDRKLYPADDKGRLDELGFMIYRDYATRYKAVARRRFKHLIQGSEYLRPNGGMQDGYHMDHILSARDGFENDVDESMISSPPNLRVISSADNQRKGRKSSISATQLATRYAAFIQEHSEWVRLLKACDKKQSTLVLVSDGSGQPERWANEG